MTRYLKFRFKETNDVLVDYRSKCLKLFSVPDFVGDACKAIASRIRGAVAGVQFDDFHKVKKSFLLEML